MLTYASVCSGIEAPSIAWSALGWRPLWFAEIEPFPCAVLAHHYPDVPNHGDFTRLLLPENRPAAPDVLIGGTPCQAFSVAGLRGGLADPRGNLAMAFVSLVALLRPRWVVWENVPGVLSSDKGRALGAFLGALAEFGYGFAYRVLDAQYFELAQRRARVFVVASPGDWRGPASVLLEPESLRWDSPPSRRTGAGVAGAIGTGASDGGGFRVGADEAAAGHVVPHGDGGPELPHRAGEHGAATAGERAGAEGVSVAEVAGMMVQSRGSNVATGDVAGTLGSNADRASGGAPCVLAYSEVGHGGKYAAAAAAAVRASGGSQGVGSETVLAYSGVQSLDVSSALLAHPPRIDLETETFVTHTLRAEGHDASEDGTGRGVPLVPVPFDTTQITSRENRSNPKAGDPCHPLAHVPAIAYAVQEDNQNGVSLRDVAGSVRADAPGSQVGGTLAFTMKDYGADAGELCPTIRAGGHSKSHANGGVFPGVAYPIDLRNATRTTEGGGQPPAIQQQYGVRRLMPHELERLQGFPDHFTRIPYRGKPAADCPDGPRAKALGNSMATPVIRWIGRRIELVDTLHTEAAK